VVVDGNAAKVVRGNVELQSRVTLGKHFEHPNRFRRHLRAYLPHSNSVAGS
jgi:hypothetical protein